MRRQEEHFSTQEQVAGYLEQALGIVADLELDDSLREIAFAKAIDLLAAKQVFFEQPQTIPLDPRFLNHR